MKAPMLKRRLNPFLLASTVLILSLLAGLSVLYQGQLKQTVSQNKNLTQKLQDQNDRIQSLQAENTNITEKLSNKKDSLSTLQRLYNGLKKDRDSLKSEVSKLQGKKNALETNLTDARQQIQSINQTLDDVCSLAWDNMTSLGRDQCEAQGHAG